MLLLTFTGEDPGIAMDPRGMKVMPRGLDRVRFDLEKDTEGTGDVFIATEGKTVLP